MTQRTSTLTLRPATTLPHGSKWTAKLDRPCEAITSSEDYDAFLDLMFGEVAQLLLDGWTPFPSISNDLLKGNVRKRDLPPAGSEAATAHGRVLEVMR